MAVWQLKFLIMGIDYFIKWVEVESLRRMSKALSRKASFAVSESLEFLFSTMERSLTTTHSRTSANS